MCNCKLDSVRLITSLPGLFKQKFLTSDLKADFFAICKISDQLCV